MIIESSTPNRTIVTPFLRQKIEQTRKWKKCRGGRATKHSSGYGLAMANNLTAAPVVCTGPTEDWAKQHPIIN